jgi:outer membrane immunogenic protein
MFFKVTALKRIVLSWAGFALIFSLNGVAQDVRSEVSAEGTGFFTKDSNGNGISNKVTESGGLQVGYRYNINEWLAAEADYGYTRNTQSYSSAASARVQSDVHAITGIGAVKLPTFHHFKPFVLAGAGALVFDPTGNTGASLAGATRETKGDFVYGAGLDYPLNQHFAIRAEYRGFVYKAPSFNQASLETDSWTHTAQPSAGIVYRF